MPGSSRSMPLSQTKPSRARAGPGPMMIYDVDLDDPGMGNPNKCMDLDGTGMTNPNKCTDLDEAGMD